MPLKGCTSLKVDPELWKEVKIAAIRRDMELSDFVDYCLRKELGLLEAKTKRNDTKT